MYRLSLLVFWLLYSNMNLLIRLVCAKAVFKPYEIDKRYGLPEGKLILSRKILMKVLNILLGRKKFETKR